MTGLRICAFFILCWVGVEGKNNIIQCYVCDDCDVFNDCLLQSCPHGSVVPSPTPTSVGTIETTAAQTTTNTTGTQTSVTLPTFTTPTKGTTQTQGTTAIIAETMPTTEAGTIFTSETEETSASTTPSLPSTDTDPTSSSSSTDAQTQTTTFRLIRNISHASFDTSVSYHCYSIDVVENYKQKTKRGCIEVLENQSACGVLRNVYGCSSKNCKVCSTDRCNSNGALRSSLFTVTVIMLSGIFSKMISCKS